MKLGRVDTATPRRSLRPLCLISLIKAARPWFYPPDTYMKGILGGVGRKPTRWPALEWRGSWDLSELKCWLLDTEEKKDRVIEQIVRMTQYWTSREDGTQWIDHTSLRCIVVKP
ncbi:hypothetical protein N7467_002371 [Penicillium canescens]|nr:hypothetical protein N7467_002371 [Penicillium canescens]